MSSSWKCKTCPAFRTLELKSWMSHVRAVHSFQPNFKINCPVVNCPASYSVYHSLYKHISNHHKHLYKGSISTRHGKGTPNIHPNNDKASEVEVEYQSDGFSPDDGGVFDNVQMELNLRVICCCFFWKNFFDSLLDLAWFFFCLNFWLFFFDCLWLSYNTFLSVLPLKRKNVLKFSGTSEVIFFIFFLPPVKQHVKNLPLDRCYEIACYDAVLYFYI